MTKKRITKSLSLFLCIVLIAAMALFTTGCNDNTADSKETTTAVEATKAEDGNTETTADEETSKDADDETTAEDSDNSDVQVLGEGETSFFFNVTDGDGNESKFEIHTNETTVGAALVALELVSGTEGEYGLYVKVVNGITADYDVDGTYWAFYIDGEYAMSGVDTTDITEGATYSFKVEK